MKKITKILLLAAIVPALILTSCNKGGGGDVVNPLAGEYTIGAKPFHAVAKTSTPNEVFMEIDGGDDITYGMISGLIESLGAIEPGEEGDDVTVKLNADGTVEATVVYVVDGETITETFPDGEEIPKGAIRWATGGDEIAIYIPKSLLDAIVDASFAKVRRIVTRQNMPEPGNPSELPIEEFISSFLKKGAVVYDSTSQTYAIILKYERLYGPNGFSATITKELLGGTLECVNDMVEYMKEYNEVAQDEDIANAIIMIELYMEPISKYVASCSELYAGVTLLTK